MLIRMHFMYEIFVSGKQWLVGKMLKTIKVIVFFYVVFLNLQCTLWMHVIVFPCSLVLSSIMRSNKTQQAQNSLKCLLYFNSAISILYFFKYSFNVVA